MRRSSTGVYENFDPVWSYPKPAQRPHPPILLGGETDHTLKRVAAYCDGWLPRAFGGFDPVKGVERLHQIAGAAGRDPSALQVTVFGAPDDAAELARYTRRRNPARFARDPGCEPGRNPAPARQERAAGEGNPRGLERKPDAVGHAWLAWPASRHGPGSAHSIRPSKRARERGSARSPTTLPG